jgi:hypothetical protein
VAPPPRRTDESRQAQIDRLLEQLHHNMDALMALAMEATDIRHDGVKPPRKRRAGRKP